LNTSYYHKKDKKTYNRNITLTTSFLEKKLDCYKGLNMGKLLVTKNHLGHKLGEFFTTKVLGERIAYRKKQKLLLKKKKNKVNLKKK
jgi:ribosomal protein S19